MKAFVAPVAQRLCLVASLLLATSGIALGADEASLNVQVDRGSVTIDARDAPVSEILQRIGEEAGFTTTIKGRLDDRITLSVVGMPIEPALRHLVGDHSMVMGYSADGNRRIGEVMVYGSRSGVAIATAPRANTEEFASLEQADRRARIQAVRALAHGEDSVDALSHVLKSDEDRFVRSSAVAELGKTKLETAVAVLRSALDDEAISVRINAARALGRIKSDAAITALGHILLENPDRRLRWIAARALDEQHSAQARQFLEWATSDPDPSVRKEVNRALSDT